MAKKVKAKKSFLTPKWVKVKEMYCEMKQHHEETQVKEQEDEVVVEKED